MMVFIISIFIFIEYIYAQDRQYMLNNSVGNFGIGNLGATPKQGTISFYAKLASKEAIMDALTTGPLTGFAGGLNSIRFEFAPWQVHDTGFNVCIGDKTSDQSNNGNIYTYLKPSEIHLNTWYHFALTWNIGANNAKGYVDGKEVFNYTTTLWPDYFSNVILGVGFDTVRKWNGGLDQVSIWKRELTKKEIGQLESWKINFNDPDLVWHVQSPDAANHGKSQSVLNIQATCFCQDSKGFIWIGTTAGLRRFDCIHYKYYTANHQNNHALHSNYITSVFEDSRKRLWVGTYDDGIYLLDRLTDKFYSYNKICSQNIKTIANIGEDDQKRIWINTNQNFYVLNEKNNCFEINKSVNAEVNKKFYAGITDGSGNYWWISKQGLKLYNIVFNQQYDYSNNPERIPLLQFPSIRSITIDKQNNIWACDGFKPLVYKYNTWNKKIITYSFPDDLEIDTKSKSGKISFGSILADGFNNIWLSLPGIGLSKFDYGRNKFFIGMKDNNSFLFYDSFFVNRNNNYPLLQDNEGNLWAGGFTNFIFFHPASVSASIRPKNVTITAIELFDKDYLIPQKIITDSLLDNKFSFHIKQGILFNIKFASLQYSHADKIRYYLKMQGYDSNWVDPSDDKIATYARLPAGHYFFRIKCENQFGASCAKETILEIFIDPPYWQTWWFITMEILAGAVFIYWLVSLRIKYVRKKEAEKNALALQLATLETKALRSQMNPHFIFNALNAIKKFLLKNDVPNADKYLSSFAKLFRLILDNTRENSVLLENEINLLELYLQLEHLRFEDKLEYAIKVDEKINTAETEIPSMIIQPFVENAIVHGIQHKEGRGIVKINFELKDGYIEVIIEDDGVGRFSSASLHNIIPHKSLAIKISEERLLALRKNKNIPAGINIVDFKDEHGKATGTKVIICIPLE
jgi:ligand-binding sensor domain-containing protein